MAGNFFGGKFFSGGMFGANPADEGVFFGGNFFNGGFFGSVEEETYDFGVGWNKKTLALEESLIVEMMARSIIQIYGDYYSVIGGAVRHSNRG